MSTLLLATDDSDPAREAASYILQNYSPSEYSIIVVSVAAAPDIMKQYARSVEPEQDLVDSLSDKLRDEVRKDARDISEVTAERFTSADYDVKVEVPIGRPGEEICRLAESEAVDGIVMGRRGRGRIGEILLGSVSHYVVHHASCAVTLVPSQSEA